MLPFELLHVLPLLLQRLQEWPFAPSEVLEHLLLLFHFLFQVTPEEMKL